jgi:site-specific recombinase
MNVLFGLMVGLTPFFQRSPFLGASVELQKAAISFAFSGCLSVRMEQLGSHLTDFH